MIHNKNNVILNSIWQDRTKWIMLFPATLIVILMCYIPITGIVLAFKRYNYHDGIFMSPWAGFANFRYFFYSGKAWTVTRNTFLYNVMFIVVGNFLQIVCAILLTEISSTVMKKVSQNIMFLPYFISWVVIGAFVYNLLNYEVGAVNTILTKLKLAPIDFYSKPKLWIGVLLLTSIFKNLGYGTVMYLASIMTIDGQLYEAAEIDGANIWKRIYHITLPSIKPTIIILLLLSVGTIMKGDFQMFYQVTGNNPLVYSTTDVIDTYVTRSMLTMQEYGMSSAAGLYQSVLSFILIMTVNYGVKRYDSDYSLF